MADKSEIRNSGLKNKATASPEMSSEELEALFREFLLHVGAEVGSDVHERTPMRAARAFEFLTSGYRQDVEEVVNGAIFEEHYDEIVLVKRIRFFSLCEHHILPFFGHCDIGYIPDGKVIGLSKIPRIVDLFARRLQLQERLTRQIADCINEILHPRGLGLVMEGYHLCMAMRGVDKAEATTVTSEMTGLFRTNPQTRHEFLNLIGRNAQE